MGGVQYGTVRYRIVQCGPRNPIFLRVLEPKNCVSQDPGPRLFGPANFIGPKLRGQGGTSDDLRAHSFPSFSAHFHCVRTQPFRVFLVGLRVRQRSKQQEEHEDRHAISKPTTQNGYPQQQLGKTFQEHHQKQQSKQEHEGLLRCFRSHHDTGRERQRSC
jgi:hypothetical protein